MLAACKTCVFHDRSSLSDAAQLTGKIQKS